MNKIIIPSIFVATILVAGMFAFMPVQKASTVHTTIGARLSAQFATVNIEGCTAAGAPVQTPACVAVDTVGIIAGGTFWEGQVCLNEVSTGTVQPQVRIDGAAFTTVGTAVTAAACQSLGGDGLWITQTAPGATDVDITVVFNRVG